MGILELKNTMTELKNSVASQQQAQSSRRQSVNSKMIFEITQLEEQKGKRVKKSEENL